MRRVVALGLLFSLLAACAGAGSEAGSPLAVLASSQASIGIGRQRLMISVIDRDTDELLASPDRAAELEIKDQNGAPLGTYSTEFLWTIEDLRGLYAAYVDLPEAGTYQAVISVEGLATPPPMGFAAIEDPTVVQVGDSAPLSTTRTADDPADLEVISSDPDPDPAFYRLSVDEAVTDGSPSVIVFATPAWCVSSTCGPLLDQAKSISKDFLDVDFVHVEIYQDIQVQSFDDLVAIDAIDEWGLPSEPWIFVIDDSGHVTATFEGVVSDDELSEAINAVAG